MTVKLGESEQLGVRYREKRRGQTNEFTRSGAP